MGQLTHVRILNALEGLVSGLDAADETLLKQALWRKQVKSDVTDGGTAGTAATERTLWINDTGGDVRVVAAYAVAPVAVTANATTFATFLLYRRTAAGGSQTTVGSYATNVVTTNDMVAHAEKEFSLTAANVVVPSGAKLTCAVTKASTGVAIASSTAPAQIVVIVEPIGA